ncbi:hypothetical protein AB0K12_40980 [Nonomuraea sp. NPDC049419]|uniref:hypothetical protein n=1 Tax=Nonomuraea sp. NPDC049419 TaxID=3155772 RepID=UPI0034357C8E
MDWEELLSTPPVDQRGYWNPQWKASVAVALAHLLAVSGGERVAVPDRPVAEAFRRAIDSLLPPGPPKRYLRLAWPGLSAAITDIALVPWHPQTGEVSPCEAGALVPLAAGVWTYLAFHDDRRLVPAAYGMPADNRAVMIECAS